MKRLFLFSKSWTIYGVAAGLALACVGSLAVVAEPQAALTPALTIDQAVDEGLHSNLDLIAAQYSIPLAEADTLTASLWNNPTIQLDTVFQPFGGSWNQTSVGGPRQYDILLSYPFDLSGKHSSATRSAEAATEIAKAGFQDAIRQKVLQIRLAYIDLLTVQSQLSLSQEKENDLKRLVQMIENKIGRKTLLPLLQRRAQLARDQAGLESRSREIAVRTAKTALALLLGRLPGDTSIDTTTRLRDFKLVDPGTTSALVTAALEQRPDLKALRLSLAKAGYDQALSRAQVWNDFNIQAGLSRQGASLPNPSDPNSIEQPGALSWSAAIQIPLPVFNRNQGNIKKAMLSGEQASRQLAALDLSIRQEIDTDYQQLKLNEDLIRDYEAKQLDSARKVRDSQQTLFGTGGSSLLDYFDAISAYQSTLSSYYDSVGECRRSIARLDAAVGRDLFR